MANNDSAQYTLRYNEVTGNLEVCISTVWTPVTFNNSVVIPAGSITAAQIDSGDATEGQLLTADGNGGATWEDPA